LEAAFDAERQSNPFQGQKGNLRVDIQAKEIAGSGGGSDLEGVATLEFKKGKKDPTALISHFATLS